MTSSLRTLFHSEWKWQEMKKRYTNRDWSGHLLLHHLLSVFDSSVGDIKQIKSEDKDEGKHDTQDEELHVKETVLSQTFWGPSVSFCVIFLSCCSLSLTVLSQFNLTDHLFIQDNKLLLLNLYFFYYNFIHPSSPPSVSGMPFYSLVLWPSSQVILLFLNSMNQNKQLVLTILTVVFHCK